jgi:hypothetical protein
MPLVSVRGLGLALLEIQNAMSCRIGFYTSTGAIASSAFNTASYKLDRKALMIMMERNVGGPHKNPHQGFASRYVIYLFQR